MANPGHVLSETRLLTHVWDENASPYTTLRKKLDAAGGQQPIETVVGAGYRLLEDA